MDDDEWNLSVEELENLEQEAKRKMAERQKSSTPERSSSSIPSRTGTARAIPFSVMQSPSKRTPGMVSVKIFKESVNKVGVETQYNKDLVSHLKTIPGHEWDQNQRIWKFPEEQAPNICRLLKALPAVVENINAVPPLNLTSILESHDSSGSTCSLKIGSQNAQSMQLHECSKSSPYKAIETVNSIIRSSPQTQKTSFIVQIYEISPDRIAAKSIYNEKVKAACQSVPGRQWNAEHKVWTFPKNAMESLLEELYNLSSPLISVKAVEPVVIPDSWTLKFEERITQSNSAKSDIAKQLTWKGVEPMQESESTKCAIEQDAKSNITSRCNVRLFLHYSGKIASKFDYNVEMVALFKGIPKSEWAAKERLWLFPLSSLIDAEKALAEVDKTLFNVELLDPFVRQALQSSASLPNLEAMYENMPSYLESVLLPFQRDGVRFSLQHGARVLIADEMGLGKTLQAIAVASCLKNHWPVLIIAPSSLRLHWALMIRKWLNIASSDILVVMSQWSGSNRDGFNIVHTSNRNTVQLDGLFNIISYDLVAKLHESLTEGIFNIVIADESHYLKNSQAKRTVACMPLLQKSKFTLLLTGTPALSRPIELYSQLEALHPDVYKSVHVYGQRYCKGGFFGKYQGASNHDELHALMKSTVMIRRLKKDVLTELPVKRREQILLSLEGKELGKMKALFCELESIKKGIKECKSEEDMQKLKFSEKQLINKIYTDSAEAKIPAVLDYLGTIIEAGCKFLIFAHHITLLDAIEQFVSKKKVGYIRIDGSTPSSLRQAFANQFQENENTKVAV